MNKPIVSMIAAISENNVLGKDNKLLWHIPEDFKRFKDITSGHPIIMGKKTYLSIGHPLPKRTNIIITRDSSFEALGCEIVHSIEEAITLAKTLDREEIFIIGGGQIYTQALSYTNKLYLTVIHKEFEGDAFFPDYSGFTQEVFRQEGEHEGLNYTFLELVK